MSDILGASIIKHLSDKSYDKRKQAAVDIESVVRELGAKENGLQMVERMIDCLRRDYIMSQAPNNRKGGLIGMASIAIGLGSPKVHEVLTKLVDPVLDLFGDEEPRVRYYACESMYNISKVAEKPILNHFTEIFEGLCKLSADVDTEVKNGVHYLDRLMKDCVTECPDALDMNKFIPLLAQRIRVLNPYIRQLVLGWITMLNKAINMLPYLPQLLEGLLMILGDTSRDIRANADAVLQEFQEKLKTCDRAKVMRVIGETSTTLVKCCQSDEQCCRLTSLTWLNLFVKLQAKFLFAESAVGAESADVAWATPPVPYREAWEPVRETENANDPGARPEPDAGAAVQSVSGGSSWFVLFPDELLCGVLHCVDDQEKEISQIAIETHSALLDMVQAIEGDFPVSRLVDQLLQAMTLDSKSMVVRTACLQWVYMLLGRRPSQKLPRQTIQSLLTPVFDTLLHPETEVVVAALRVLAQIMEQEDVKTQLENEADESLFTVVSNKLFQLFAKDRRMLETRGRLVIRQLCGHLDARRFYTTVAQAINRETDLDLAAQLVQMFSWILLTARETRGLREELRTAAAAKGPNEPFFRELLVPWFHSPVSALALCLWAQQYDLASELTQRLAEFEPTVEFLRQLDLLVTMIESPIFRRMRLQLLEPRKHPALLRSLLGLTMLLPQASAFQILKERIHVAQVGLLLEGVESPECEKAGAGVDKHADASDLVKKFDEVLNLHGQRADGADGV